MSRCLSTKFPKFAQLPPEVQILVWGFSCHEERVIDVRVDLDRSLRSLPGGVPGYFLGVTEEMYYHTKTRRPAVLSACIISRTEALRYYTTPFQSLSGVPAIYVNPACDVVIPWGTHFSFPCGDGTTHEQMFMGRVKKCGMRKLGVLAYNSLVELNVRGEFSHALEHELVVAQMPLEYLRHYDFTRSQWHLQLSGSFDLCCSKEWLPNHRCCCAGCILKRHVEAGEPEGKKIPRLRIMNLAVSGKSW